MNQSNKYLFEVSWEICNKVSGIHTVLQSKLGAVKSNFGDNYCVIGPLFENNPEFEEVESDNLRNVKIELKRRGIIAKVGTWKVPERPLAVLVKYTDSIDQSKLLYSLWADFGVDSMTGGWDYVEPVLFSTMAAKVIEVMSYYLEDFNCIAQFHEWMSGAGLLYLKKNAPTVATVFITHSTILGRTIAANGLDLYSMLNDLDPSYQSARFGVTSKHSIESISARESDCFGTVSDIAALEVKHVLGTESDVVMPNGFCTKKLKGFNDDPEFFKANRKKLINFASRFLKKDLSEENTIILSASGRKDFRNKGIDMLLDSLNGLNATKAEFSDKQVVLFMFFLGGYIDRSKESKVYSESDPIEKYFEISTHPLWENFSDPIVVKCKELSFHNTIQDNINVIYVPVHLNGSDGVLNIDYYDALSGCDLTVNPYYYEPWGNAPLESVAYSVPTITSDLSGFGKWKQTNFKENQGCAIIARQGHTYQDSTTELTRALLSFIKKNKKERDALRMPARTLALNADWDIFYKEYLKAYDIALLECVNRIQGRSAKTLKSKDLSFSGTDSARPRLRRFSVKASIPKELEHLRDLAFNIWWSWDLDAYELFSRLDPILFERIGFNPITLLDLIDIRKMQEAVSNESYMSLYETVLKKFDKYVNQPHILIQNMEPITKDRPIAYFSMEFGFHESIPIYSGGLGILSGDHIKSASDVNIPLVGVGLLYKNGYFRQSISKEGEQRCEYPMNDFFHMPIKELSKKGEKLLIAVEFPGRILYARVWLGQVGRVTMYLLDTDIPENGQSDREITSKLYGGGKKTRIEQEILLGIGGIRLLERELSIYPSVYHLNEGHSAFLILERLINLMKYEELDLETAKEVIKASTVFTTHTPVPAGNETFDMSLIENYLKNYVTSSGLSWTDFVEMGHKQVSDQGPYEMTVLALKHTYKRNGVSELHGDVSRKMWADLWSGFLTQEVPIFAITNGVHVPTWLTKEMKNLFIKYCSISLNSDLLNKDSWKKINDIPDDVLWQTHIQLKNKLFNFIKEKISQHWIREGEDPSLLDNFLGVVNPSPLTIGFARRFATYKRPMLFMRDLNRLKKILSNRKQPVQFVIAGKCHPEDKEAYGLIKEIVALSKQKDFLGKVIFLENYDMRVARRLVSGCDIWLNNPRRPLEASGTSGQKAGINGVVNFSILDGWWDEGYDGVNPNGWNVGDRREFRNVDTQDIADSDSLYDTLEYEIIPMYYERNNQGVPERWIRIMKNSLISVISQFNTHRMLKDYLQKMYIPTAKKYFSISQKNYSVAKAVSEWKKSIRSRFSSLHIRNVTLEGLYGDNLNLDDQVTISVELEKGRMIKDEIHVELMITCEGDPLHSILNGNPGDTACGAEIKYLPLTFVTEKDNNAFYKCSYKADKSGKFNYGVRVLPYHPEVDNIIDINLIYWG